jgi:photosystem II stability/assembly factor-like uncharacterized protein
MLSADTIFACGSNNSGGTILKSVNGGLNWTVINPGNTTTRNSIAFVNSNIILVSATTDMRRSTDGGANWTGVTLTGASTIADIEVSSATDVWAVSTAERIYRSTDAGASFTLHYDGPSSLPFLSVSFIDANTGIFTGGSSAGMLGYKTTNAGATFDTIKINKFTGQIAQSVEMTSPSTVICAADMGCMLKSTDGGVTWVYREFGSRLYAVDFINATTGVAVGWKGIVAKTSDGGLNWSFIQEVQGNEGELYDVKMFDANTFYACGDQGRFWVTTNGGTNFIARHVPITNAGACKTLYFFNQSQGYTGGEMGSVYYTTDVGVSWTQQYSFGTTGSNNIEDINFANDSVGYVTGDQGKLAKTTNRLTWDSTGIDLPTTVVHWTTEWFNPNTGFIGSTNGRIYKTTNGGVSWTLASDTAGLSGVDVIDMDMVSQTRGIAAAELGNMMVMDSVSGTFKKYPATLTAPGGLTVNLWGVDFVSSTKAYMSGYNSALYVVDITPVTAIISNEAPAQYTLKQNYPNPFNPVTKIQFSIPKNGFATLKVYDILGKQVAALLAEELTAGSYETEFDASQLSSGVYFYRLNVNGFTDVKKMIVQK